MASLAGKADPTLAKMAYAAGMANIPGDYSKYHQSIVDKHKALLTGIEETALAFKEKKEAEVTKFNEAMKVFDDPLNTQMIDAEYEEMQTEVTAQREAWKANKGFKKDPRGLQDWKRKNQEIIGRHDQDGSTLQTIADGVKGELYDITGRMAENGDLQFATSAATYTANLNKQSGVHNKKTTDYVKNNPGATPEQIWANLGGNIKEGTMVKYKDPVTGEHTYISKVKDKNDVAQIKNVKSSELINLFEGYLKADDVVVGVKEIIQKARVNASRTTNDYKGFSGGNKNAIEDLIDDALEKNPNALDYLYGKKFAGEEFTFEEALRNGTDIGLTNEIIIGLGGVNDKNGILEKSDFAAGKKGIENYNKVIDGILDGSVKSVDGKKLLVDYIDKYGIEPEHKQLKKTIKDKNTAKGLNLSYGYKTWGQMKSDYDSIEAGKDIIKGGDGTIWNKQNNGTYKLSGGEDVRTPNQLKDHLELNHLDDFEEFGEDKVEEELEFEIYKGEDADGTKEKPLKAPKEAAQLQVGKYYLTSEGNIKKWNGKRYID